MKIGYTGYVHPACIQQELLHFMEAHGHPMDLLELDLDMSRRDAFDRKDMLKGYEVIICAGEKYTEECLDCLAADGLKLLSRHGVGTDEIRKDIATELGIAVCNARGALSSSVAECALSLILCALHQYPALDRDVREGLWNRNECYTAELSGKTIGLIGFGGIAQRLAKYLTGFDCRILAHDLCFSQQAAQRLGVTQASVDEILAQADVVSLHTPLTAETEGMVNMAFLKRMKQSAVLINTSRGKVVAEKDLCEALQNGTITAAGLDCLEHEPATADNPLLALRNIVVLPHAAAHTYDSQLRAGLMACRNALDFIEGRAVESLLNPEYKTHC